MSIPSTRTAVANKALRILGSQTFIQDVDDATATDNATVAMRELMDSVIQGLLRDYPWSFAMRLETLVLLSDDPTDNWLHKYRYPTTALQLWSMDPEQRIEAPDTKIPREIFAQDSAAAVAVTGVTNGSECQVTVANTLVDGDLVLFASIGGTTQLNGNTYIVSDASATSIKLKNVSTGEYVDSTAYGVYTSGGTCARQACKMILCDVDEADAKVWVTVNVTDISLWPGDFIDAVAARLAFEAAPTICGMDKGDVIGFARTRSAQEINRAKGNNSIERKETKRIVSGAILARQRRGRVF